MGMPGTLPVINRRAVELVMLTGLALDCHVETEAVRFERKNYFYPDLPKGYQISQYALPLTSGGRLAVPVPSEGREVTHRHHPGAPRGGHGPHAARRVAGYSVVDFNRAGLPLMEIVTEPDLRSPAQARAYGETLRELLRAIGAIQRRHGGGVDADRGQRQPEADGLRPRSARRSRSRTSTASAPSSARSSTRSRATPRRSSAGSRCARRRAAGTRSAGRTIIQRSKEEANDYRYFPEPDLPPLRPSEAWVAELRARLPELPGTASRALHRCSWASPPMTPAS